MAEHVPGQDQAQSRPTRASVIDRNRIRQIAFLAARRRAAGEATLTFEAAALQAVLPSLLAAHVSHPVPAEAVAAWAAQNLPLLYEARGPAWIAEQIERRPRCMSALAIGNALEIAPEEREAINLLWRKLGRPVVRYRGQTDARLAAEQRRADRARKAEGRREAQERAGRADQVNVAAYCREAGIGRTTFYRQRRRLLAAAAVEQVEHMRPEQSLRDSRGSGSEREVETKNPRRVGGGSTGAGVAGRRTEAPPRPQRPGREDGPNIRAIARLIRRRPRPWDGDPELIRIARCDQALVAVERISDAAVRVGVGAGRVGWLASRTATATRRCIDLARDLRPGRSSLAPNASAALSATRDAAAGAGGSTPGPTAPGIWRPLPPRASQILAVGECHDRSAVPGAWVPPRDMDAPGRDTSSSWCDRP